MKNYLLPFLLFISLITNAQVDPADNCSAVPVLTMGTTCVTNDFTIWGNYDNNALIIGNCLVGNDRDDGWYQFVATSSSVRITTYGDQDYSVAIFTSCGSGTEIACNYMETGNLNTDASGLTIGNTYYVQIHRQSGTVGTDINGDICIMQDCGNDADAPTGTAPADLNVQCSGDVPAADPLLITDEADNCGGIVSVTHLSDVSDTGTCPEIITRTYRLTDDSGNNTDVQQLITINDTQDPTGTAPADVSVANIGDVPLADPLSITDEADNCSPAPLVQFISDVSDNNTCPEVITRTYEITDDCGNNINVYQTITVNDDATPPTATAPAPVTVEGIGDVPLADPSVITDEADNSGNIPTVTWDSDVSDNNTCPETITRTYNVTDECGNFISLQQLITVEDVTNPVMNTAPANVTVECIGDVPAMTTLGWIDNVDGSGSVSGSDGALIGGSCGGTITRTWMYTDGCGNFGTANHTITVNDTQDPTGSAPANATVACNADVPAADITAITDEADNCSAGPIVAHVSDVSDNNTSPEVITRTYSITDDCGNAINVQQLITVTAPTCSTPGCLVAQYDFTGNADDASGNGNNGTVNGATLTTDRFGNSNSAYSFDGVDDHIATAFSGPLGTDERTIHFWAKSANVGIQVPVDYGSSGGGNGFSMVFNNPCEGIGVDMSSGVVTSAANTTDDQWHSYTITFDPNDGGTVSDIKFYQDGTLLPNASCSALNSAAMINTLANPLVIGANTDMTSRWFDGEIDDIKVFSCAFDASVIDSVYQAEAPAINCGFGIGQNINQPTCSNDTDGAINLTVGGGQAPISYDWSNGETSQDISGLQPGSYTVIITDANGCDTSRTIMLAPSSVVNFNVATNNASCGSDDGSAFVSVTTGTSPYSYSVTSGDTTNIVQDLAAGLYAVTVTDNLGCSASEVFLISDSDGPTINGVEIEPTCPSDDDGGVNVTVTGGATPYNYSWSDGSTNEDVIGVGAGTYEIEVEDNNGCVAMASFELTGGNPISLGSFALTNPSCGNSDGEIAVSASGGNGTLDYLWSPNTGGQTTATATSLGAGAYTLMVMDDNGCTASQNYMLSNVSGPTAIIQTVIPVTCNGNGGGVNLEITGGVPPFTYLWSNGETTQDLQGIPIGDYDVMVTDGNGCSDMISGTVPGRVPQQQEICVITVDSLTQTNLVVWEKPSVPDGIEYYKIYREGNAAGVFTAVDTVHYSSLSEWTDPIADPSVRGWRYKIGAVDSCGNESQLSTYHKSIHLTINQGLGNVYNLIWDDYIGQNIPSWIIERYHSSTGWEIIDTIPSNLGSYTDNNAPSQGNSLDYSVYGEPAGGCTSTRANHNTTRSNQATGIIEFTDASVAEIGVHTFDMYPNPAQGSISISTDYNDLYEISIFDLHGKLIRRSLHTGNTSLNISELTGGVYLVEIRGGDDELKVMKLIKE